MFGIFRGWLVRRIARSPAATAVSAGRLAEDLQAKIQELEAGRSQTEGILQGMVEGVLAVGPNGEILLVNRAAREILGIEQDLPVGTRAGGLIRQPQLQELIDQTLTKQEPQVRDLTLVSPVERHLRLHTATCQAPEGRGALVVLHDITDLKRLENLRRDFVANVSHELKTPLTAIRGAVETLLGGASKDPAHSRSFLEVISEESARLDRLVEDLLTLAQVESKQAVLRREPISMDRFLEEEIGRHQALARTHQVSLQLESPPSAQSVFADRSQMSQAVSNLLDNAIKYNRAGGRVTVRALAREGQCRIEVEDSGIGIPAGDLPRIFERFYRVDKARSRETGGTGLGLSIVKHVAEAHGGSVQVESQLGKGSRFILSIPLR
ncbi:MAG: PAS domain-containing protein [Candidatus Omnitrophica bacterium]|nr:PAS domain-containing protein [Candidatus Omnitrophota bacterium]